jgi:glycosyltransferase involved in cell wall biosynthesis
MPRLRIGIDGRELVNGVRTGIGRYLVELLRTASAAGEQCILYADRPLKLDGPLDGITVQILGGSWTPWWDQVRLPRQLKRDGISVLLSPYWKGPLRSPCPVVITIHDLLFIGYPGAPRPFYDRFMARLARAYTARAVAIITDSAYSQRVIVERTGVAPSKVRVIPVGVGEEFTARDCPPSLLDRYGISGPYVLSVSNFLPHKNLGRLIQAYAALDQTLRAAYRLVLAGNGDTGRLKQQVLRLGLEGKVLFPGWIDPADLPVLYSRSALFVLPSLAEGFGLPALEAMACGAPVATSDRTALPEVVGDAALLFDPEDLSGMAQVLTRILEDPQLRADLAQRGIRRVARFSREQTAAKVLALLHEVGKGHDGA